MELMVLPILIFSARGISDISTCFHGEYSEEVCCTDVDGGIPNQGNDRCWDGIRYTYEKCCQVEEYDAEEEERRRKIIIENKREREKPQGGSSLCWIGSFTYEYCCEGGKNIEKGCFDIYHSWQRCCKGKPGSGESMESQFYWSLAQNWDTYELYPCGPPHEWMYRIQNVSMRKYASLRNGIPSFDRKKSGLFGPEVIVDWYQKDLLLEMMHICHIGVLNAIDLLIREIINEYGYDMGQSIYAESQRSIPHLNLRQLKGTAWPYLRELLPETARILDLVPHTCPPLVKLYIYPRSCKLSSNVRIR